MFCSACGHSLPSLAKYCSNCGKETNGNADNPDTLSKSSSCIGMKTFKSFYKKKMASRNEKVNKKQKKEAIEVIITIGILQWSIKDLKLKPVRGKRIPIKIKLNDSYSAILVSALDKFRSFYEELLDGSDDYVLCYENGNQCILLPGSEESFNLKKYQAEIGRDFKRIVLYLCSAEDFSKKDYDSDSEGSGLVQNKEKKLKLDPSPTNLPLVDQPCCSKSLDDNETKIKCPVCFEFFTSDNIVEHGQTCADMKYDFFVYSSEENDINNDCTPTAILPPSEILNESSKEELVQKCKEKVEQLVMLQKSSNNEAFKVRRRNVWNDFINHRRKVWSNPENNFIITFLHESGIDTGGPRREFFTAVIRESSKLLFDKDGVPVESLMFVNERHFEFFGNLMAMALLQTGLTTNILCPWVYQLLASKKKSVDLATVEVSKQFLEEDAVAMQVNNADEAGFSDLMLKDEVFDQLSKVGYCGIPKFADKSKLLQLMYFKAVVEPRLSAIHQLGDGMNIRDLLDEVQNNPIGFELCFMMNSNAVLTLERIFEEIEPSFSENGSNKVIVEEDIFKIFCDFLENCYYQENSRVKLHDVLQFVTGSPNIPIGGFHKKITVLFKEGCSKGCRCYPTVSTCALNITFPVHLDSYEAMANAMTAAILEAPYFGNA